MIRNPDGSEISCGGDLIFTTVRERTLSTQCLPAKAPYPPWIKPQSFAVMIRSSVMFDGRLMVNASFETNVERVYAAGPAAKFVGGRASDHAAYDSAELGGRVADALTRSLGVREDGGAAGDEYVKPLSVRCRLPGRINYLHAAVPGFGHGDDAMATTYRTGDAVDGRYFEMATDGRGHVLAVSCYSKHVSAGDGGGLGKIYSTRSGDSEGKTT